ncbi:DUF3185 family protein [Idiomarina loihiensis]|jgi:uncharacterized membrane protein HdeD (DUF308 family)|uniref:DUF3185 family protein n=1 Tax=Idiomarina TaxID=135575 RepID=UPI0002E40731|nr:MULTISPECIES: DUF3185 family protein [Idiomarina]MAA62227.1 DUF3185 domain-containing protein [Idiomarina sp.]NWO03722.1 DUF3185 family protein [Idiomarinaceae bacterium]MRJ45622.1 DUF3185 family protein [Idiomarina loihiensis]PWW38383.1 uncharacterized protein DUF3185 [Idiomarina loihiensis]TDO47006.1 uncharacterized protein DUF3185 [Idiomarina sp. 017G]|tara:strand:+ start:2716 stop:2913 length:198 start_codon:yes stop_codon:yes gene_type:complete
MTRIVGIVLLVVGAILLYFSYEASQSIASSVSEVATNEPTDNTIWYLIGGVAAVIIGLYAVIRGK